jgi:hypothetical protein
MALKSFLTKALPEFQEGLFCGNSQQDLNPNMQK